MHSRQTASRWGLTQHPFERPVGDGGTRLQLQDVPRRLVDEEDRLFRVDHHHALDHAFEYQGQQVALLRDFPHVIDNLLLVDLLHPVQ